MPQVERLYVPLSTVQGFPKENFGCHQKTGIFLFKVFSRNFLKVDGSDVNKYLLLPNGNGSVLTMGLGRDQR